MSTLDPFSLIFFLLFFMLFFYPGMQRRIIEIKRLNKIRELEKKFNARVITMIHRLEAISILGFPIAKYITIEDAESVLRAIRSTPPNKRILFIIHTPGGVAVAAQQIALALKEHKGEVIVSIPHYAMSGGTLIALAADKILIDPNAFLGPVDPIINGLPAVSIIKAVKKKKERAREKYLILADIAEKAINQIQNFIINLLKDKYGIEKAKFIAEELTSGKYTHDYPITASTLKEWGLNVSTDVPKEIYELLELYPQPKLLTSVEYIKKKKK